MVARALILVLAGLAPAAPVAADGPEDTPLHCWWRTSTSAVRIGEAFSVVLTCGVQETPEVAVTVDRSRLDPAAAALPPFEVLGGAHAPDLVAPGQRFFQYEYTLRLISDGFFGADVPLPNLPITYRIRRTAAGQQAAVEGAPQTYALPQVAVRIVSLVPDAAHDIRDATPRTFAALDAARMRADLLVRSGIVMSAIAVGLALVGLSRIAVERRRGKPAAARRAGDLTLLRGVNGELSAIARTREATGWTPVLVARALAALRVLASYAVGRPIVQHRPEAGAPAGEGAVPVRTFVVRGGPLAVSGSATPGSLARAQQAPRSARHRHAVSESSLDALRVGLDAFTRTRYGRNDASGDASLDEALATARRVARQLMRQSGWLGGVTRLAARARSIGSRPWLR